tara:strand:- start:220 stop:780 length:561 start_codon:yes stop_codon:yes gene_type:complete
MKTFQQFILEAYDKDVIGRSQIRRSGEGGRIYPERKSGAQTKRTKAVGGGKTAPAKTYKTRKDAGVANPKRSPAGRQQQPTRERGSAALSAKEAQKKAYLERKAKEKGEKTKTASELLAKKAKAKVDPKYKPQKASGYTRAERQSITRKGEKKLRDLTLAATGKKKESELKHPITHKERARRSKAK